MFGVELDKSWWSSTYSPRSFIPLKYSTNVMSVEYLRCLCDVDELNSNNIDDDNFALLFCYFNNGNAFRDYILCYDGNFVIIIGPGPKLKTYTDPEPFSPNFGITQSWYQVSIREFDAEGNFISIWKRNVEHKFKGIWIEFIQIKFEKIYLLNILGFVLQYVL